MSIRSWVLRSRRSRAALLAFAVISATAVIVLAMMRLRRDRAPDWAQADRGLPAGALARLGTPFYAAGGHDPVFSPDGKRLAVLGHYHVHVFDTATRSELFSVRVNPTNMYRSPDMGIRFTNAGDIVAFWCGYRDQPALVWHIAPGGTASHYPLAEGKLRRVTDEFSYYEREASGFSISDDGTRLAVNWSGKIEVYEADSGTLITPPEQPRGWRVAQSHSGVTLSPDGRLLAVATGPQVRVFSVESGDEVDSWEIPNPSAVRAAQVSFSRDRTLALATRRSGRGQAPGAAHIRNLATKQTEDVPANAGGPLGSTAFSPSGDRLAIVPVWESEAPVAVWDTTGKKTLHRLAGARRCTSAVFSPDGKTLATVDRHGVIGVWDAEIGQIAPPSADPPSTIRQLRYLDDGRRLAAFPGRWVTWEVDSAQRSDRLAGAGRVPELSPDGKLAARLEGDQLAVLDAENGNERWSIRLADADRFTRLRFSPDGTRLVTRTRETVRVWDVANGRQRAGFPVLPGQYLLAVSSEAKQVAIGHLHPKIQGRGSDGQDFMTLPAVYETATGKKLWEGDLLVSEPYPALFSSDGRLLAYEVQFMHESGGGGPGGVAVCDAATGKVVWRAEKRAAYSMAFSPDGELLALGHSKGEINLHNTTTGKVIGTFGHKAQVTALTFSPDGKTLAAASPDAPVYLWAVSAVPRTAP
jgi:WD40 repeat protein